MGDERPLSAAETAADEALRTLVTTLVSMAVLVAVSVAVEHREQIAARLRHGVARIRRRPAGGDTEIRVAEFRADVTEWGHADGQVRIA